jgi:hypothetical protein
MFRFFRQIRQRLLINNKFSRYLLYAIGEILLVVIGILIAFKVDNWNEKRKDRLKLKIAIESLQNDILQDSLIISQALPAYKDRDRINRRLMDRAYSSSATLDTLIQIMKEEFPVRWISSLPFNQNTFENLKSTGAFELLPEDVKKALSDYYTTIASNKEIINFYLDQYRTHMDDFVDRYNIIGRLHHPNYQNSYLFNATWKNIDEEDFVPRVAVILGSYDVMYSREIDRLEELQHTIRAILPLLNPYVEG